MNGFKGVKIYQDQQRWFVDTHGYIILNDVTKARAHIYDWPRLCDIKSDMDNHVATEWEIKEYRNRISTSEKQAIDYKIQGSGSACFKLATIKLFKWLEKHNLLFVVLLCIPAHDRLS
jgi:DNA polymerase I-like protein with 3'-5' exonuclease and polymerase domains